MLSGQGNVDNDWLLFYSAGMEQISYKTLKFSRRFGVEIEINKNVPKKSIIEAIKSYSNHQVHSMCIGKSVNNKQWHVKFDITCGRHQNDLNGGWEVASFVGHTAQDILHMGEIATVLKDLGAKVNRQCGLHIHAEVFDLQPYQVGILIAQWIKMEHILKCAIPRNRNLEHCELMSNVLKNNFGERFRGMAYTGDEIYEFFLPQHDGEDEDYDPFSYRYRAINVINYYMARKDKRRKRRTIELRLPESSLEADDVVGWTRLYLNFLEQGNTAVMPDNLHACDLRTALGYLGLYHEDSTFYLFGPSLNKTRIWFLNKLINNLDYCKYQHQINLKKEAKKLLREIKN